MGNDEQSAVIPPPGAHGDDGTERDHPEALHGTRQAGGSGVVHGQVQVI